MTAKRRPGRPSAVHGGTGNDTPTDDAIGSLIARRYRIDSILGVGGMGVVYAATDLATDVEVAIKNLSATSLTETNLRRLRREAKALSLARHKHICAVYHLGVDGDAPFIVMERLAGETVRDRLEREGAFSAADAIAIVVQMLEGLEAAHQAGVLHRDIKPSNVLIITPPGQPPSIKLIDFGLAKPFGVSTRTSTLSEDESAITRTDVIPGTPQYLTPEQLLGQRDLDARVDVWATALTLFEMLTGRRRFPNTLGYEVLVGNILRAPPPRLSAERADLPVELDAVIARALAKDRDDRYPTADALRSAIVASWARHRAEGIARGSLLKRSPNALGPERPKSLPVPPPPVGDETPDDVVIVVDEPSSG